MHDFQSRQQQFLRLLEAKGLDGCVLTHPPHLRYLFNFTGSVGITFCHEGDTSLIIDSRYLEQAKEEVVNVALILATASLEESLDNLILNTPKLSQKKIAFEAEHVPFHAGQRLKDQIPKCQWVSSQGLVEELRITKEESEITVLETAFSRAQDALRQTLNQFRPGISEQELAGLLELEMRRAGGEGSAFDTIVASGPRSSLPHGVASERLIPEDELILIDFGIRYQGYNSDLTRIHLPPEVPEPDILEIVREAHQAAIDSVRPGVPGSRVDEAARSVITRHGFGENFGHATGHGLGLEVHELPRISGKSLTELRPGMVFTIEPGIYLPGKYGVRIEDAVVVTDEGLPTVVDDGQLTTDDGQTGRLTMEDSRTGLEWTL